MELRKKAIQAGGNTLDDMQMSPTSQSCGLRDPDGNTLELIQYL